MHKRGILAFEQILFAKALETMQRCAEVLSDELSAYKYRTLAERLKAQIKELFWDKDAHAYLHAIENGEINKQITKFPNMFAIIYGLSDENEREQIMQQVMLNPSVDPITTPYMRFYELEALCMMGQQAKALPEMKAYWGGMLREGATSFWEKYVPSETGIQHLAMYGRPYGKSLCHAWGASPIYIIGKYFLGIRPVTPGYKTYEVRPTLGGLEWMEGEVPTPFGRISIKMDRQQITVHSDGGHGTLIIGGRQIDIPAGKEVTVQTDD
jgi:hypothetical protein